MKLLLIYFPTTTKRDVTWKMLENGVDEAPAFLGWNSTISRVVLSVLHLLQRLSRIKFLQCEQYKWFKIHKSSREIRVIYSINLEYEMKFYTRMQRGRPFCFLDTALIALFNITSGSVTSCGFILLSLLKEVQL